MTETHGFIFLHFFLAFIRVFIYFRLRFMFVMPHMGDLYKTEGSPLIPCELQWQQYMAQEVKV